ncbi:MAG: PAS domain S-box protein, partial [Rhizobiaceae bacterium]|nr:PAS domain S-box protein [Rhizobiaceae bacterium]
MFKVLTCLEVEHDFRLVVLAGLLCVFSSFAAMMLLHRARNTAGVARWIWLISGGAAGGFGIWSTHFVAMLAYNPGVVFGYEPTGTLSSLAIAILTTTIAMIYATYLGGRSAALAAGLLFGMGVSSMHFLGMSAIEFPGSIIWDRSLVLTALGLAIAFAIPAFVVALSDTRSRYRMVTSSVLLTLGIVLMHFTAMGAITIMPGAGDVDPATLLSPTVMVITIAAISFSLLSVGLSAALFAIRAENAVAEGQASFKMLVQGVTDYAIYMLDPQGHVANWNAGAERAKGYTADEIVGKHFSQFYLPEEKEAGLPAIALQRALKDGKFESEGWRLRKDGSRFWAHVAIDPIFDDNHVHVGFAKITKD